jgi:hypothetical protein
VPDDDQRDEQEERMPSVDLSVLDRCRALGVALTDDQWRALPEPARRRLARLPHRTELEKRSLAELARWMLSTFPPGWRRRPD